MPAIDAFLMATCASRAHTHARIHGAPPAEHDMKSAALSPSLSFSFLPPPMPGSDDGREEDEKGDHECLLQASSPQNHQVASA